MLLCFVLAATFWTLNSLNKTYYNIRISYPLEFVYNPEQLVPLTEPPKEVVINVNGKGWKLLRKALDLHIRPARIELPNRLSANYLTSRQLRPYINAALSSLVLNYIITDTIYFNFEPLVKRPLHLTLDSLHPIVAPGFKVSKPVSLAPQRVVVTGPASLVNALPDPFPVHISDSLLTKPYNRQVPLAFMPSNLVKSKTRQVKVVFNVKPIPFQETNAVVQFQGENPDVFVGGPPTKVKLRYQPAAPTTRHITADSFTVVADITRINLQDTTVALTVAHKPGSVKTVTVLPQKVKVHLKNR